MTAVGDVFQLKQFCSNTQAANELLNVFWYRLTSFGAAPVGSPMALPLAAAFGPAISAFVATVVESATTILRAEVVDYGDPTDFVIIPPGGGYPFVGTRAGAPMPMQVALTMSYTRANPGLRNGYKRFGALSEDDVQEDQISVALKVLVDVLATAMNTPLVGGVGQTFEPVIAIGAKILGTNPAVYVPLGVNFAGVGSQNSRKQNLNPIPF